MIKYEFVCGKTKMISENSAKTYRVLGEIEACMHDCPDKNINSDVNNCTAFLEYYRKLKLE